jgi:acetoacetyl-CoA synthetase
MVDGAAITAFAEWVEQTRSVRVTESYDQLWQWSVDDLEGFWAAIWEYFDVQSSTPPTQVLGSREMPGAEWFPGTRLNYAEHVFRDRDPAAPAIQHASELRALETWTWGDLRAETARIANGLRRLGVQPGDRVAGYLPNVPHTVAAFLAVSSIGAIWSCAAPEFGSRTVIDRFAQIEPTVLLAVDGYRYGGKDFDRRAVVDEIRRAVPSIETVVLLDHLGTGPLAGSLSWEDLTAEECDLRFVRVPFDHALWVLYSSGTTGLPKAIVHGHGGILLEHLKTLHLHLDAQHGDRVFWFTTTGWMMWNFLVGVLLTPATIVLYDGNPATPTLDRLWDLAAQAGITTFGTSASYLATCQDHDLDPHTQGRDLTALKAIGSTGSPLSPESFRWVYQHVGPDTWLFSTSGGTDVCTAFVGGVPTLPVYLGELQARALGADIHAYDPDGHPHLNTVGELVITQPMPSMPTHFWADTNNQRLHDAYYNHYPNTWRHGDWIQITDRHTAIITGRSDATINRGGIRIGTSEIYRAVLTDPDITDALVVDIPKPGTEGWMPLFVVLRTGLTLDDPMIARIKTRIRTDCSPRHTPNTIHQITEVPRTLSGKALELPVKHILMGQPPTQAASRDSLANPHALDHFVALAQQLRA